jgi:single-strand DNA-binding protein
MNNINLIGRLTKDPELKQTQAGAYFVPLCVAVDRGDKNRTTDFIDCLAWNKTAEFIAKYFKKGKPIEITGKLTTRTYEKNDGTKVKATEVLINEVGFVIGANEQAAKKEEPEPSDLEPTLPFEV